MANEENKKPTLTQWEENKLKSWRLYINDAVEADRDPNSDADGVIDSEGNSLTENLLKNLTEVDFNKFKGYLFSSKRNGKWEFFKDKEEQLIGTSSGTKKVNYTISKDIFQIGRNYIYIYCPTTLEDGEPLEVCVGFWCDSEDAIMTTDNGSNLIFKKYANGDTELYIENSPKTKSIGTQIEPNVYLFNFSNVPNAIGYPFKAIYKAGSAKLDGYLVYLNHYAGLSAVVGDEVFSESENYYIKKINNTIVKNTDTGEGDFHLVSSPEQFLNIPTAGRFLDRDIEIEKIPRATFVNENGEYVCNTSGLVMKDNVIIPLGSTNDAELSVDRISIDAKLTQPHYINTENTYYDDETVNSSTIAGEIPALNESNFILLNEDGKTYIRHLQIGADKIEISEKQFKIDVYKNEGDKIDNLEYDDTEKYYRIVNSLDIEKPGRFSNDVNVGTKNDGYVTFNIDVEVEEISTKPEELAMFPPVINMQRLVEENVKSDVITVEGENYDVLVDSDVSLKVSSDAGLGKQAPSIINPESGTYTTLYITQDMNATESNISVADPRFQLKSISGGFLASNSSHIIKLSDFADDLKVNFSNVINDLSVNILTGNADTIVESIPEGVKEDNQLSLDYNQIRKVSKGLYLDDIYISSVVNADDFGGSITDLKLNSISKLTTTLFVGTLNDQNRYPVSLNGISMSGAVKSVNGGVISPNGTVNFTTNSTLNYQTDMTLPKATFSGDGGVSLVQTEDTEKGYTNIAVDTSTISTSSTETSYYIKITPTTKNSFVSGGFSVSCMSPGYIDSREVFIGSITETEVSHDIKINNININGNDNKKFYIKPADISITADPVINVLPTLQINNGNIHLNREKTAFLLPVSVEQTAVGNVSVNPYIKDTEFKEGYIGEKTEIDMGYSGNSIDYGDGDIEHVEIEIPMATQTCSTQVSNMSIVTTPGVEISTDPSNDRTTVTESDKVTSFYVSISASNTTGNVSAESTAKTQITNAGYLDAEENTTTHYSDENNKANIDVIPTIALGGNSIESEGSIYTRFYLPEGDVEITADSIEFDSDADVSPTVNVYFNTKEDGEIASVSIADKVEDIEETEPYYFGIDISVEDGSRTTTGININKKIVEGYMSGSGENGEDITLELEATISNTEGGTTKYFSFPRSLYAVDGGDLTPGDTTITPTNIVFEDVDNSGISIEAYGTVNRGDISGQYTVGGYHPMDAKSETLSISTSEDSTTATKYIRNITIGTDKTLNGITNRGTITSFDGKNGVIKTYVAGEAGETSTIETLAGNLVIKDNGDSVSILKGGDIYIGSETEKENVTISNLNIESPSVGTGIITIVNNIHNNGLIRNYSGSGTIGEINGELSIAHNNDEISIGENTADSNIKIFSNLGTIEIGADTSKNENIVEISENSETGRVDIASNAGNVIITRNEVEEVSGGGSVITNGKITLGGLVEINGKATTILNNGTNKTVTNNDGTLKTVTLPNVTGGGLNLDEENSGVGFSSSYLEFREKKSTDTNGVFFNVSGDVTVGIDAIKFDNDNALEGWINIGKEATLVNNDSTDFSMSEKEYVLTDITIPTGATIDDISLVGDGKINSITLQSKSTIGEIEGYNSGDVSTISRIDSVNITAMTSSVIGITNNITIGENVSTEIHFNGYGNEGGVINIASNRSHKLTEDSPGTINITTNNSGANVNIERNQGNISIEENEGTISVGDIIEVDEDNNISIDDAPIATNGQLNRVDMENFLNIKADKLQTYGSTVIHIDSTNTASSSYTLDDSSSSSYYYFKIKSDGVAYAKGSLDIETKEDGWVTSGVDAADVSSVETEESYIGPTISYLNLKKAKELSFDSISRKITAKTTGYLYIGSNGYTFGSDDDITEMDSYINIERFAWGKAGLGGNYLWTTINTGENKTNEYSTDSVPSKIINWTDYKDIFFAFWLTNNQYIDSYEVYNGAESGLYSKFDNHPTFTDADRQPDIVIKSRNTNNNNEKDPNYTVADTNNYQISYRVYCKDNSYKEFSFPIEIQSYADYKNNDGSAD